MHLRAIYNEPLKSIEQKIRLCYFIIVKVAARDVIRDNNTKIRRDKYNYQRVGNYRINAWTRD